ncbi:homeodomain-like protein, partial [Tanacetum coccineum]
NVNPPPTNNPHVLPNVLRAKVVREINELQKISAYIDSRLENIDQFLNGFTNQPNGINVDDLEPDDGLVDTPLVSPFLDLDDEEVLNELEEYGNAGKKFVAYFDPFLPMNIITRKAYNTIMVDGLGSTWRNLVAIVKDVYVFVGSFTYIIDFVVLEDIGEFIVSDMTDVVMGKPFREVTKLEYDYAKGLLYFTRTFDNYTFQMPHTIPRFKSWGHMSWSKIPPILVLSQRDLINGFRNAYEKNKFMYKNCLNLGPEYQVDKTMKEWLIHGHVLIREEARHPVTIHINSISLIIVEEEENVEGNEVFNKNVMEPDRSDAAVPPKESDKMNGAENRTERIAEDVLVKVVGYMYPVDFIILDIKEDEKRPFILGTPFLTTAKAVIKFDKGKITLRSGKNKISFHIMHEPLGKIDKDSRTT